MPYDGSIPRHGGSRNGGKRGVSGVILFALAFLGWMMLLYKAGGGRRSRTRQRSRHVKRHTVSRDD